MKVSKLKSATASPMYDVYVLGRSAMKTKVKTGVIEMTKLSDLELFRRQVNTKTVRTYRKEEKQIERAILDYLELKKITAWKQNNGAYKVANRFIRTFMDARGNSICGIPDIAGYLKNGKALFIEVKKKGSYPTPDQKAFLQNARDNGCVAFVARSVDDVELELKGIKK